MVQGNPQNLFGTPTSYTNKKTTTEDDTTTSSTTESTTDPAKGKEIIQQIQMRQRDADDKEGTGGAEEVPVAEATAVTGEDAPPVIKATAVEGVPFVCCPFGFWSVVLPLGLGYVASILAIASIFSCYLVGNVLWGYSCYRFIPASSYGYEDIPFRYGRIASFLGGVGGLVYTGILTGLLSCTPTTMMTSLSQKRRLPSTFLMGIGFGVLSIVCFSALVASLTKACHNDDDNDAEYQYGLLDRSYSHRYCEVGPGMILSMISGLLFLGAAISLCLLGRNRT